MVMSQYGEYIPNVYSKKKTELFFSNTTAISSETLEKRIDFHLRRMMRNEGLKNFKKQISGSSVSNRILESLLSIIVSFVLIFRVKTCFIISLFFAELGKRSD